MIREEDKIALWAERIRAAQSSAPLVPELPADLPPTRSTTRDAVRSRRRHATRGQTIPKRTTLAARAAAREAGDEVADYDRPGTRGECLAEERPCPFVSCAHHLYLDVSRKGALKLNFPDLEVWELTETCALDVAERNGQPGMGIGDGATLEEVGEAINITRERVRQIEEKAIDRLERLDRQRCIGLAEHAADAGITRKVRRLPLLTDNGDDECDE